MSPRKKRTDNVKKAKKKGQKKNGMFRVAFLSPPSRRRQSTAPFLDDRPMIRLFFVVVVVVVVVVVKKIEFSFFSWK